jgi:hypothetical protein
VDDDQSSSKGRASSPSLRAQDAFCCRHPLPLPAGAGKTGYFGISPSAHDRCGILEVQAGAAIECGGLAAAGRAEQGNELAAEVM